MLILDELYADDSFSVLVGKPETPIRHYPQALAIAIALRHSWRRDDLQQVADRLGLTMEDSVEGSRSKRLKTKR